MTRRTRSSASAKRRARIFSACRSVLESCRCVYESRGTAADNFGVYGCGTQKGNPEVICTKGRDTGYGITVLLPVCFPAGCIKETHERSSCFYLSVLPAACSVPCAFCKRIFLPMVFYSRSFGCRCGFFQAAVSAAG